MYSKFSGLVEFEGKLSTIKYEQLGISDELAKKQKVLKPHHHVNLDKEFRGDCEVLLSFLESQDSSVCHPFVDLSSSLQADQLFFYTDSSANPDLGFGAIFGTHWVFGQWEAGFVKRCKPSIAYLELFAICTAFHIWQRKLKNLRLVLFCDNQSVVNMVNQTTSKCQNCMSLIRKITLLSLKINARIFATYVSSRNYYLADYVSHLKIDKSKQAVRDIGRVIDEYPSHIPEELWPVSKIWIQ